jgi:hypothetical protein
MEFASIIFNGSKTNKMTFPEVACLCTAVRDSVVSIVLERREKTSRAFVGLQNAAHEKIHLK